jgi:hypothetical protein
MSDTRDGLRTFIEKLTERQDRGLIRETEYRLLISECRISLTELDTIDGLSDKHMARARKALTQGKYESAVAEMERAVTLTPMNIQRRAELGDAYLKRYEGRGFLARDLERASGVVHDILTLKPQSREGQQLKKRIEEAGGVFSRPRRGKTRNWIIPLVILILILAGISYGYRKEFSLPGFLSGIGKREGGSDGTAGGTGSSEIPSWFKTDPDKSPLEAEGLTVSFVTAEAKISRGAWVLDLQGTITPVKDEYRKLTLELRWPAENPKIIKEIPVIKAGDPPARPGDSVVLDAWLFLPVTPEPWSRPVLAIKEKESGKPGELPGTVTIPVFFEKKAAEGTLPVMTARSIGTVEGYDRFYYPVDLEVANTGYKPLNYLELEVAAYGSGPEPAESRRFSVVERRGVPLEPGTRRVIRTILESPVAEPLDLTKFQIVVHDSE